MDARFLPERPRSYVMTVYLTGIGGRQYFIASWKHKDQEVCLRKAAAFVKRILTHPAQRGREYVIRTEVA